MLEVLDAGLDDCWNKIGVTGDQSCPELAKFVHCRNCPVFGSAARSFFHRAAPDGYLRDWANLLAQPVVAGSVDQSGMLVFRLGIEWLAVNILAAVEVTSIRPVHRIPHRTNAVFAGLINLRGQLHPCVSLHGLLQVDPIDPTVNPPIAPRLILIRKDNDSWAFPADEVAGVQHIARANLQHIPSTLSNPAGSYSRAVFGWGDRSVNVLDEPRVFAALRRMGA